MENDAPLRFDAVDGCVEEILGRVGARLVVGTPLGIGKPNQLAWKSVREVISGLGMPSTLRDVGLTRDNLDELSKRALDYQPVLLNPRPITTTSQVMEILEIEGA